MSTDKNKMNLFRSYFLLFNFYELGQKLFHQICGTDIDTKLVPPYKCIFKDKFETHFLETQHSSNSLL